VKLKRTILWGTVLATVAAIVVPVAQAKPTGPYSGGTKGAPSSSGLVQATSERSATVGEFRTGEYGAPSAIGLGPKADESQTATTGSFKTGEYGAPNIIGLGPKVAESTSQPVVTTTDNGFAWNDFGIGAGIALAAFLLASVLLLSRRRQAHVAV
jgi:hypothetical protein